MTTLLATRAWLRPVSRGNRHFTYGPFNPYIPIRSTTIGKSRVAKDLIAMRTSWRSNSDIASVTSIGYPRMSASGESSTTRHRLLHASGSHPIPPPNDPKKDRVLLKGRIPAGNLLIVAKLQLRHVKADLFYTI
ncbi:hypothetical protein F511_35350 [Dorcoceras hygrometricum]|uniref:Uncharacterized protein n=1 Tax=Dorcoceras hygrometricum TaxID=472368 RepID=A0A2Z7BEK6_9LAMI|nr:hypothetical protein F511_35350 [Dorcoceras hygrometricum]